MYLDAEIKVIDGQPVMTYETEEGYEEISFSLSDLGDYAYADGQKMLLQTQGNSILVPREESPVAVPIEDFCVVMVDGQVALMAEENPRIWWFVAGFLGETIIQGFLFISYLVF